MNFKYAIALTGGIATGKSTTADIFRMHGYSVIDADEIAHLALDKCRESISDIFGSEFVIKDRVDRKALGRLIFSNPHKKALLEELLHPLIQKKIFGEADKLDRLKKPYLVDIPLFYESKNYPISFVIVVYASRKLQLSRLVDRDNSTQKEALSRINSQIDIETKKQKATCIIDNCADLEHLHKECLRIEEIINDSYKI